MGKALSQKEGYNVTLSTRCMFKTQQSYFPIWTDGIVVVFAVEVNFVFELTTSERTRILIQLSYSW